MRQDVSDLVAGIDLAELATELLGPPKGRGRSAKWPSPVQDHAQTGATPPMGVFVDRYGKERWKCFATGETGDAVDLLMAVEQVSFGQAYALAMLRSTGHASVGSVRSAPAARPKRTKPPLSRAVIEEIVDTSADSLDDPMFMPDWLAEHGIEWSWVKHHRIGWFDGELPSMKYPVNGAVVLPVRSLQGDVVGADLRVIVGSARYLCVKGPGWDGLNFVRPAVRRRSDVIAVTEGSADAIGFAEATGVATVGIASAGIASSAVERVRTVAAGRAVAVATDDDVAGNLAAEQFLRSIPNSFRIGLNGGDVGDALGAGKNLARFVDGGMNMISQQGSEVAL